MEANIINVGNSKGIIIPAKFLKLIGLENKAKIVVDDDKIIIEKLNKTPRVNWSKMFSKANAKNDTELLIPDVLEDESLDEWTW